MAQPQFYMHEDGVTLLRRNDDDTTTIIAQVNPDVDGAGDQLARSLNRLPLAEALLVLISQHIKAEIETIDAHDGLFCDDGEGNSQPVSYTEMSAELAAVPALIEEWMVADA